MDREYANNTNLGSRISVEIGTMVKIELENVDLPFQSSVVGMEIGWYIIVKAPEPFNRVKHQLTPGIDIIIRFISGGTAYAFQAKLIETISTPIPLLFVEYPEIIQQHDLREQKRVNCHIPSMLKLGDKENIGCIVDLAGNGCRCVVQGNKNTELIDFDIGDDITIRSSFPGSAHFMTFIGKVKNIRRTNDEYDLGMSFSGDISAENIKLITGFIMRSNCQV